MKENKSRQLEIVACCNTEDGVIIESALNQENRSALLIANETSQVDSILKERNVDMVILDLEPEEKSKLHWLKRIAEKRGAPIIVLAPEGKEDLVLQSLEMGAVGHLYKNELNSTRLADVMCRAAKKWRTLLRTTAREEQLEKLASADPLTGLLNRRAILRTLRDNITRASRYGEHLSVILLDIDNFKEVNDTQGHKAGDTALRKVAAILEKRLRHADSVGRYGGDEFLIVLPQTDLAGATRPAERIRQEIEKTKLRSKNRTNALTASLGVAEYKADEDNAALFDRVDRRLYCAKQNGRNQICAAD